MISSLSSDDGKVMGTEPPPVAVPLVCACMMILRIALDV